MVALHCGQRIHNPSGTPRFMRVALVVWLLSMPVISAKLRARVKRKDTLAARDRATHGPQPVGLERIQASESAATPGNTLPSSSSSEAPPPVEQWVTLSSVPHLAAAVA